MFVNHPKRSSQSSSPLLIQSLRLRITLLNYLERLSSKQKNSLVSVLDQVNQLHIGNYGNNFIRFYTKMFILIPYTLINWVFYPYRSYKYKKFSKIINDCDASLLETIKLIVIYAELISTIILTTTTSQRSQRSLKFDSNDHSYHNGIWILLFDLITFLLNVWNALNETWSFGNFFAIVFNLPVNIILINIIIHYELSDVEKFLFLAVIAKRLGSRQKQIGVSIGPGKPITHWKLWKLLFLYAAYFINAYSVFYSKKFDLFD
ncbi:hypothetical protein NH340_JMT07742 [Sarcoptes scabiei]|nr:hypothetical protein NH340_JMT07742 [Sarcoptes scabiei]